MSAVDICVLVLLCIQNTLAATTSKPLTTVASDNLTCPFRTVNYITHTLPQQCLPSSRSVGASVSQITNPTVTIIPIELSDPAKSEQTSVSNSTTHVLVTESSSSLAEASTYSLSLTSAVLTTTITATPVTSTLPVPAILDPVEEDSALESGNFLSFEEWKKQNLIRAGQSEHLGRNVRADQREPRKVQANVHNTLDSLGDEAEIDLDFSGLVPEGPDTTSDRAQKPFNQENPDDSASETQSKSTLKARGKDAGTTSKERFNYASFDCAANVLKSNPEAKSPLMVLRENKDSYMLNKCSAKSKFVIIELCEDLKIDTVVLANFEFFSSSFRTFRVSVSDRYPVKAEKWKELATFEARNTREVQAFLVENPIIWARYVKVEFLTHYGKEFYCPVSLVRVHGYTMLEEYKHDQDASMEEDDDEAEVVANEDTTDDNSVPESTDESIMLSQHDNAIGEHHASKAVQTMEIPPVTPPAASPTHGAGENPPIELGRMSSPNEVLSAQDMLLNGEADFCLCNGESWSCGYRSTSQSSSIIDSLSDSLPTTDSVAMNTQLSSTSKFVESRSKDERSVSASQPGSVETSTHPKAHNTSTGPSNSDKNPVPGRNEQTKANATSKDVHKSASTKQSGSGTQPHPSSPTMQESFFKQVQKRLNMLESNSSLSLQYIEEQSRALRDAFRKVEQRQLSRTAAFLEHLNQTVLNELREFRQQYDHLWQSTVIELELQRELYQQENQAMHARLGILADELIFQRRVSILQMILILVCLGLILFSRGPVSNYLELPLLQSVLSRSPNSRWASPSRESQTAGTPAMVRSRSAHQLGAKQGILKGHRRGVSEDSLGEAHSPSEMYSPPTPVSFDGYSDGEVVKADFKTDDPEFDPVNLERPSTSPPVLPGLEDPTTPRTVRYLDGEGIEARLLTPESTIERSTRSEVKIEGPTPPGRHLTWNLPDHLDTRG